ncbi:hypothetical protein ARTHRO_10236 [Limnospira indica PCC 8005]|uniref:Uncharacterized protein n=1 Tax=Limnospira indica PCC 8005 TaxID=376219 RepID=A0A9P1KC06_9CYAN|nr:hypothetical protein ARTHRO_10236 [Limnospira indica PCC 8005]
MTVSTYTCRLNGLLKAGLSYIFDHFSLVFAFQDTQGDKTLNSVIFCGPNRELPTC